MLRLAKSCKKHNSIEEHWFVILLLFPSNQIQFAPFSSLEMQKEAHIHVVSKNLYSQDAARTPAAFGVLDPKLVSNLSPIVRNVYDTTT